MNLQGAMYAARMQAGDDSDFALDVPVGLEQVQLGVQVCFEVILQFGLGLLAG
jgi:hypothetical protein